MTFTLSVVALLLGPFVYALGKRHPTAHELLNGLIFITIAGVVCVHIIPQALEAGGNYSIAFLLLGLAFPVIIERGFHHHLGQAHAFVLTLAGLGLIIHASIDGIALLPMPALANELHNSSHTYSLLDSMADSQLAVGVIIHRLPVGMAIWWTLRPHFGTGIAITALLLIIAATALTYFLGEPILALSETRSIAYFQAFVAGSLVHIAAFGVTHEHDDDVLAAPAEQGHPWSYRVGILFGMFMIFAAPHTHL